MSSNTMLYALYRLGYHGRATTRRFRGVASTILNESNLFNRDWIEPSLHTWKETKCGAPTTLRSGCVIVGE